MARFAPVREARASLHNGTQWLTRTQGDDGSWHGDYGGPLFLLPLYIATCAIIEEPIDPRAKGLMIKYLRNHQNDDGGFGLHVEGPSTVYGTSANYVALRLLGIEPQDADAERARSFLHQRGGPLGAAAWGKFLLALLDLYPYQELYPVPPELWLLPDSAPVHPARLWCHCRMVYLPMSYLFRKRVKWNNRALIESLRAELYPQDWKRIDWASARLRVAPEDLLVKNSTLSRLAHQFLRQAEKTYPKSLSKRALDVVLHQIDREDKNTSYICIGPINKLLNTLCWHCEDKRGPELQAHRERLQDYLYEGPDGIRMQGYNSSRLWDTCFAAQALLALPTHPSTHCEGTASALRKAHDYIESNQVRADVCDAQSAYRDPSRGGWPFSDVHHGWPISDCTAEGIKASLALSSAVPQPIEKARLQEAVELLLFMQNEDGGWATYEKTRGAAWLEQLNPSNCFRDIMIDYSYVECTSACLQALSAFDAAQTGPKDARVHLAIERGKNFLCSQQRADGGFEGSWGVCFTYGTWFGVWGLRAAGLGDSAPEIARAQTYLLAKQNRDGGWGESVKNCVTRTYAADTPSQVVMTSWALLALMSTGPGAERSIERGIEFLIDRQQADGTYPSENIAGVFNKTCAITYDNYLKIFPVWALSAYLKSHPSNHLVSARPDLV